MQVIILSIIVFLLCLLPILLGILLIKSGNRMSRGQDPIVKKSVWEKLFWDHYLWIKIFGDIKGSAFKQIWLGICAIIWGIGLLLMLLFGGFL